MKHNPIDCLKGIHPAYLVAGAIVFGVLLTLVVKVFF